MAPCKAIDMVNMFDEMAPPTEIHNVMMLSVQTITQSLSPIYEAQIARGMKLCGFAQKKALSRASLDWQEALTTYLPKTLAGVAVNKPAASDCIHPALLAIAKKSAEQVVKKSVASSSGGLVVQDGSTAASSGGPVVPDGRDMALAALPEKGANKPVPVKKERETEGGDHPKKKALGSKPPLPPPAAKKRRGAK